MNEPGKVYVSNDEQCEVQKYYDAYLEAAAHDDLIFDDLSVEDYYFSYDGDAYG